MIMVTAAALKGAFHPGKWVRWGLYLCNDVICEPASDHESPATWRTRSAYSSSFHLDFSRCFYL